MQKVNKVGFVLSRVLFQGIVSVCCNNRKPLASKTLAHGTNTKRLVIDMLESTAIVIGRLTRQSSNCKKFIAEGIEVCVPVHICTKED